MLSPYLVAVITARASLLNKRKSMLAMQSQKSVAKWGDIWCLPKLQVGNLTPERCFAGRYKLRRCRIQAEKRPFLPNFGLVVGIILRVGSHIRSKHTETFLGGNGIAVRVISVAG